MKRKKECREEVTVLLAYIVFSVSARDLYFFFFVSILICLVHSRISIELPPQPNTRNIFNLLKLFVTRVTKVRKPSRSQVCEAFGQVTYWAVFYSDHLTAFWSHVIVQVTGNFFFTV